MNTITFITGNKNKFAAGKRALEGSDFDLIQEKLEVPEIQSTSVEEIACYSAQWASNKVNKPVVVTDAGYYISALNGFPGPFIKFMNQWLKAEDILKLLEGKSDRSITVRACLAFAQPKGEPVPFVMEVHGTLADQPATIQEGTEINRLFIPPGRDSVIGLWSYDEQRAYWASVETFWRDLIQYLQNE